jgi:hypothetical protein
MATTPNLGIYYPIDTDTLAGKSVQQAIQDQANAIDAPWGAWTGWTPVLNQGATSNIAKTVDRARYKQRGKLIKFEFRLTVTGTGTANAAVTLTTPPANAVANGYDLIGFGGILDSSVPTSWPAPLMLNTGSASTWVFAGVGDLLGANGGVGTNFIAALAANDVVWGSGWFERT